MPSSVTAAVIAYRDRVELHYSRLANYAFVIGATVCYRKLASVVVTTEHGRSGGPNHTRPRAKRGDEGSSSCSPRWCCSTPTLRGIHSAGQPTDPHKQKHKRLTHLRPERRLSTTSHRRMTSKLPRIGSLMLPRTLSPMMQLLSVSRTLLGYASERTYRRVRGRLRRVRAQSSDVRWMPIEGQSCVSLLHARENIF